MNNEMVTIIIPMYNAEKYIEECIQSIVNQTYENIEILIIDDASTDKSLNVAKKYEDKDERITVISLKENKGAANSRKEGTRRANGNYVMFIDADDWIDRDAIEKCMELIKKYNCDIIRFGIVKEMISRNKKICFTIPYKKEKYIEKKDFKEELYPIMLETYSCNSMCAQLIRKDLLNDKIMESKFIMGEDLYCNIKLFDIINSIVFVPEYLYHYRLNEKSITTTKTKACVEKKLYDVMNVYTEFFLCLERWNMKEKYEKKVALRVLKEMTEQYLTIFLVKKIKKTDIENLYIKISNEISFNKIKKIITKEEIRQSDYKNKRFMLYVYTGDLNNIMIKGKILYKGKVRLKELLKRITKEKI